jgi:hypothetical protein
MPVVYSVPRVRRLFIVTVIFFTASSCDVLKSKFPTTPIQDWTQIGLPQRNGNGVLIEVGGSRLELSPTLDDALTRLGSCTDAITYCYSPGERDLDQCVASVNVCDSTLNPSGCCPSACQSAYTAARNKGTAEIEAFDQVFFQNGSCFPGVSALVGGSP